MTRRRGIRGEIVRKRKSLFSIREALPSANKKGGAPTFLLDDPVRGTSREKPSRQFVVHDPAETAFLIRNVLKRPQNGAWSQVFCVHAV